MASYPTMGSLSLKKLTGSEINALRTSTDDLKIGRWTVTNDLNSKALIFVFDGDESLMGMKLDAPATANPMHHMMTGIAPASFVSSMNSARTNTSAKDDLHSFANYDDVSLTKQTAYKLDVNYTFAPAADSNADPAINTFLGGDFSDDGQSENWRNVTADREYFYCAHEKGNFFLGANSCLNKYRKSDGKLMWSKHGKSYFTEGDIMVKAKDYVSDFGTTPYADADPTDETLIIDSWRNIMMAPLNSEGAWIRGAPVFPDASEEEDDSGYFLQGAQSNKGIHVVKFSRSTGDRIWAAQIITDEGYHSMNQIGSLAPGCKKHDGKNYVFIGTGSLQNASNRNMGDRISGTFGDRGCLGLCVDTDPADMSVDNAKGQTAENWVCYTEPPLFSHQNPSAKTLIQTAGPGSADSEWDPFRPGVNLCEVQASYDDSYGSLEVELLGFNPQIRYPLWGYESGAVADDGTTLLTNGDGVNGAVSTDSQAPAGEFKAFGVLSAGCTASEIFSGHSIDAPQILQDQTFSQPDPAINGGILDNSAVDPTTFVTNPNFNPAYHANGDMVSDQCVEADSSTPPVYSLKAGFTIILIHPASNFAPPDNYFGDVKYSHTLDATKPHKTGFPANGPNYALVSQPLVSGVAGANDSMLTWEEPQGGAPGFTAKLTYSKTFASADECRTTPGDASTPYVNRIAGLYYPKFVSDGYQVQDKTESQNLNYLGAMIWGGSVSFDFAKNIVYSGTGQNHKQPEDESKSLNLVQTAFLETRMQVIDAQKDLNNLWGGGLEQIQAPYAQIAAGREVLRAANENAVTEMRQYIADGLLARSPRGLLSHFDAIVAMKIYDDSGATPGAAGDLIFGCPSVNWDEWTSLGRPTGPSVYDVNNIPVDWDSAGLDGNDGDLGAGVCLFKQLVMDGESAPRDVCAAATKGGINFACDAATGETLQMGVVGPAAALGGADYNSCSDGKEVVFSTQMNMSAFEGAVKFFQPFGQYGPSIPHFETSVFRGQTVQMGQSFVNAWNARTGKTMWNFPLEGALSFGGLSFHNGMLVVNCLGKPGAQPILPVVYLLDGETGEVIHKTQEMQTPSGGGDITKGGAGSGQIVSTGGLLIRNVGRNHFGLSGGPSSHGVVLSCPLADQAGSRFSQRERKPVQRWNRHITVTPDGSGGGSVEVKIIVNESWVLQDPSMPQDPMPNSPTYNPLVPADPLTVAQPTATFAYAKYDELTREYQQADGTSVGGAIDITGGPGAGGAVIEYAPGGAGQSTVVQRHYARLTFGKMFQLEGSGTDGYCMLDVEENCASVFAVTDLANETVGADYGVAVLAAPDQYFCDATVTLPIQAGNAAF